jgi:uncharacterized protein YaiI (UPF0178 family)
MTGLSDLLDTYRNAPAFEREREAFAKARIESEDITFHARAAGHVKEAPEELIAEDRSRFIRAASRTLKRLEK